MAWRNKKERSEYLKRYRQSASYKEKKRLYLESSKEQRKQWAKCYYQKHKQKIIDRTTEYRKTHLPKLDKSKAKHRSIEDRKSMNDHYVVSLLIANTGESSKEMKCREDLIEIKKAEIAAKRIKRHIQTVADVKICKTCKVAKPKNEFDKKKSKYKDKVYDLLNPHCKKCYSLIRKKYKK